MRKHSTEKKFWSRVNKDGPLPDQSNPYYQGLGQCWEWTGIARNRGYGTVQIQGKVTTTHRKSYELSVGVIPNGMCVLHKCDNKICVNPSHLFIGTFADNNADKMRKGRHKVPYGDSHPSRLRPERMARGVGNAAAKLNDKKVRLIRGMRSSGIHFRNIAKKFGVSSRTIVLITQGKTWKHVT